MNEIGTRNVPSRDRGRRDERLFLASLLFVALVTILWFALIGFPSK